MSKTKGMVEVGKPIYKTKEDRLKARNLEVARQIKYYCKSNYPCCIRCDYCEVVNKRACRCKVNNPHTWDIY